MTVWIVAAAISAALAMLTRLGLGWRAEHYCQLESKLQQSLSMDTTRFEVQIREVPDFSGRLSVIPGFLSEDQVAVLEAEVERLAAVERSYVPTHKKGGTVAYAQLIENAPAVTHFYHSASLRRFVSRTVGVEVQPTPLHDQSSLSILVYDQPGDHIDWHYDHNFYRGRHFTVLLPLINKGSDKNGLSHARLSANLNGLIVDVATPANTLVLFEGAKVLHKASPIRAGERRIVISMTFCADPRATFAQAMARRFKDTAFFGVRALWT